MCRIGPQSKASQRQAQDSTPQSPDPRASLSSCSVVPLPWGLELLRSPDRHCPMYQMRDKTRQEGNSGPGGHGHSQGSCPHSEVPQGEYPLSHPEPHSLRCPASGWLQTALEPSSRALGPGRAILRRGASSACSWPHRNGGLSPQRQREERPLPSI